MAAENGPGSGAPQGQACNEHDDLTRRECHARRLRPRAAATSGTAHHARDGSFLRHPVYTNELATTLIDSAIRLALKKKATMQCTVPTARRAEPWKVTSAVWAEVPITHAK